MRFLRSTIAIALAAISLVSVAQVPRSGMNRRMTKAVFDVYARQLAENPRDYEVYFCRASEYYRMNEYMRALDDINKAIAYMPSSADKDTRLQAYMLRASIYDVTDRPQEALADLRIAADLDPNNYIVIYQKANAEYEVGEYAAARVDYQRLRKLNTRSVESNIGLARLAVLDNDYAQANKLVDEAVSLDQSNPNIYVRRASVRQMMKNDTGAVDDLLYALSIDPSNSRALRDLVRLAETSYGPVMAGLSSAINQAPRQGMLYYIRAVIAQAHYRYVPAIADFRKIIDDNLYNYQGIHASLAECYFAVGKYDDALNSINRAIGMNPNVPGNFVVKARILRAMDQPHFAVHDASQALVLDQNYTPAVIEKGLCLVSATQYAEANDQFGEAMLADSSDPYLYMLRAWVLNGWLNQPAAAATYYSRVVEMNDYQASDPRSLRGFALLCMGDKEGAVAWMEGLLAASDDFDGRINYLGACLYSQAGMNDKALECMSRSLDHGYANYYDWTLNNDARINVENLRHLPEFEALLQKHATIFGR